MRFLITKVFLKIAIAITLVMAMDFSYASYCDMMSCATEVALGSKKGFICSKAHTDCECATLPSDCYAAQRVNHACKGDAGWVLNHGKMIGSKDGSTCCGYKLASNETCPEVPKDEQPIVRTKDFNKGFFVNEFYGWSGFEIASTNGSRNEFEKAYLDICLGSHHVNATGQGSNNDKLHSCLRLCRDPKINKECKANAKRIGTSVCEKNCHCLYTLKYCRRD
jgi:hypothetical protein